jgi:hypothetical protein
MKYGRGDGYREVYTNTGQKITRIISFFLSADDFDALDGRARTEKIARGTLARQLVLRALKEQVPDNDQKWHGSGDVRSELRTITTPWRTDADGVMSREIFSVDASPPAVPAG